MFLFQFFIFLQSNNKYDKVLISFQEFSHKYMVCEKMEKREKLDIEQPQEKFAFQLDVKSM